jgi:hypothetical protein
MKLLIINNRNSEALTGLVQSLRENIKGNWTYCTFDATGTLPRGGESNVTGSGNLKEWVLSNLMGESDGLYTVIDENKIAIGSIDVGKIEEAMSDDGVFCFSLALGKNITFCSNMNCDNVFKPEEENNGAVKWDWSVHYMDFGYPLNLDGTVFRGKELSKLIRNVSFSDTLELENGLQIFDDYPKNMMAAFSEGKMIEVIFENPDLRATFDHDKLEKDRTKYQILENHENPDKVSDEVEA